MAAVVDATVAEHIYISDGRSHLRLDVLSGSMLKGAVNLQTQINSDAYLGDQIAGLQQLYALCTRGRLLQKPFVKPQRRVQIITALRVHDARIAGASQREIATALFGAERVTPHALRLATGPACDFAGGRRLPPEAQSPLRARPIRPPRSGVLLSVAVVARTCGLARRP